MTRKNLLSANNLKPENYLKTKFVGLKATALALLALSLAACSQERMPAERVGLEVATAGQHELIFSATTGAVSAAQTVSVRNTGGAPLIVQTLELSGPDAEAFKLNAPSLPLVLEPGGRAEAAVSFVPPASGTRRASLQLGSNDDENSFVEIGLYGLGSRSDGEADEPSLQQVVDTLGYGVNVADSALAATGNTPLGDEIAAPLFERAAEGPVTLRVVARYGPSEPLPYGVFTLGDAAPVTQEVGEVAAKDAQELLPPLGRGDASFEPGTAPFGVYAETGSGVRYSLEGLNEGDTPHALRVYPLRDRDGNPVANSYLLGLEAGDASRDFQDALFVIGNVRPSGASPDTTPNTASGWEPLFNGTDLSGWYSYLPSKGKNNDPEGVFRAENGTVHILGVDNHGHREFGYLATEKSYSNYHLRLEYRWGDKRFAPRDNAKRDSGVVYHVTGRDMVWPRGVEYQIQEGDTGDFWLLGGPTLTTTVASVRPKEPQYAQNGTPYKSRSGRYVRIIKADTHEQAGWNTVDIIVRGDTATHMINGQVNNRAYSLHTPSGEALEAGKILLQAEGAEVFYRNIQIRQLE